MERYSTIPVNAQISALPLLDPLVPGRMESMPNRLAFVPQFGTSLSNNMVGPTLPCRRWLYLQYCFRWRLDVGRRALCTACTFERHAWPEALLANHSVSEHS